jgi:hypothetical protein
MPSITLFRLSLTHRLSVLSFRPFSVSSASSPDFTSVRLQAVQEAELATLPPCIFPDESSYRPFGSPSENIIAAERSPIDPLKPIKQNKTNEEEEKH